MSKLKKGDNPTLFGGRMMPDEKGKVDLPPEKSISGVSPIDVRNNTMKLTSVEKYSFKEINGKVYRIGKNGIEYPPISKKQFEEIKKLHKEFFDKDDDRNI